MSRRAPAAMLVSLLVSLPALLGGCGAGSVLGIHDAPPERPDEAAVTADAAKGVADRVLHRAADHRAAASRSSAHDRREIFSGPALREVGAAARSADSIDYSESVSDLKVLGISHGRDWPRAILATSQDAGTQYLHVLVSRRVDEPYTLFADVRMSPGARVPALAPVDEGSPVSVAEEPDELAAAATAWGEGMAYPAPEEAPSGVSFEDSFSKALQKNAKAQAEDVEGQARYRQRQATGDAPAIIFDLAAGGELSFVPMSRTDIFTVEDTATQLSVGDRDVRRLLDSSTVGRSLSVKHAETVAIVAPESGEVMPVGASSVLHRAKGR